MEGEEGCLPQQQFAPLFVREQATGGGGTKGNQLLRRKKPDGGFQQKRGGPGNYRGKTLTNRILAAKA